MADSLLFAALITTTGYALFAMRATMRNQPLSDLV